MQITFLWENKNPVSKMKEETARILASFYIFVNLFSVWLNRHQLDSHICFCVQSLMIYCFLFEVKEEFCPHTGMSLEKRRMFFVAFLGEC